MNVLKVLHYSQMAGTELSTFASARALADRGHRVSLLHNHNVPFDFPYIFAQLSRPDYFGRQFVFKGSRDYSVIQEFLHINEIDVLHFHSDIDDVVCQYMIEKLPSVYTRHVPLCPNGAKYNWGESTACDLTPSRLECMRGYFTRGCGKLGNGQHWPLSGFMRTALVDFPRRRRVLHTYTKIVCVSREHRNEVAADLGGLVDVVYVPEPVVENVSVPTVCKYGGDRRFIFAAGRLVEFKGFSHLLLAFDKITADIDLVIAGEGPGHADLVALVEKLGLQDRVRFLGAVTPAEMNEQYLQCLLCVVPSLWRETFCRVGVEALAYRKPVIAYFQGGVKDWLVDGINGFAVIPGDLYTLALCIDTLAGDPEMCERMGHEGYELSREWTIESHGAHVERVLLDAISAAGSKP